MPNSNDLICELVVPDAGPLITLAYAKRLDLLFALGLKVVMVDMVKQELIRQRTDTSEAIISFIDQSSVEIAVTDIGIEAANKGADFQKSHAGERAIQEYLFNFSDEIQRTKQERYALLLFEDHKIAGTNFVLPDNVYVLSTRAFLDRLEKRYIINSAADITRDAIAAGRSFSQKIVDQAPKSRKGVKPF